MMTRISALFISLIIVAFSAHADVYKYRDSSGNWRYSDVPPRSDVKYDVLVKKKDDTNKAPRVMTKAEVIQAMAPNQKDQKNTDLIKGKESAAKVESEKLKAEQLAIAQENATIREENCRAAKINFATYQNGGRIKRTNEKGEAAFLSDADIANGKASAQKEVEQYCNS